MDNQIMIYGVHTNFRLNRKKNFRGHMVRYAATVVSFPSSTHEWINVKENIGRAYDSLVFRLLVATHQESGCEAKPTVEAR